MDDLGARLKAARKAANLTQAEVQTRLGFGPTAISEYESGKSGISDERLVQLASLYGVDASELAGRQIADRRPDAFYDGILHALATFNKASGELIAEVQAWRGRQATGGASALYSVSLPLPARVQERPTTEPTPPVSRAKLDETGRRQLAKDAADARKRRGTG